MNQIIKELERLKMVNETLNQKLPIPVFVTDQRALGEELKEVLCNYFFVRAVEACEYKKEELLHMVEARLQGYGYCLREDAYDCMEQYMEEKTWDEVDMVETQVCGMLDQLIFDHTLQTERTDHKIVEKEEVEKIFTTQTRKQHTIGFVIG